MEDHTISTDNRNTNINKHQNLLQRLHNKQNEKKSTEAVSILNLFRYATLIDVLYILFATIAALGNGIAMPMLLLISGNLLNTFTNRTIQLCSLNFTMLSKDYCPLGVELTSINFYQTFSVCNLTALNLTNFNSDFKSETQRETLSLVAIGFSSIVLSYIQATLWRILAERQTQIIRRTLFRSILREEVVFFDKHKTGELNTHLTDDIDTIHNGIGDKLGSGIQLFASVIVGFAVGFAKGWKLTLVVLSTSSMILISTPLFSKLGMRLTKMELEENGKANAVAEEVFSSIRTVLCYNGQEKEQQRYEKFLDCAKTRNIQKSIINGIMIGMIWFIVYCCYALTFWYGTKLILEENYNIGDVYIVFLAVLIAIFNLGEIGPHFQAFSQAKVAVGTIWKMIDSSSITHNSSEIALKKDNLVGEIHFSNVHFCYPSRPDIKVLHNLSFDIKHGQTIALIGSSGSGKSTCIQLLQRFYDLNSGSITIDGIPVNDFNLKWLRQQIGVVNQEPVLFQTTIRENILLGKQTANDEEVHEVAKIANAHDFIMNLPEKYETMVGQRGTALSGGQKQRIAIARALISDPKILLLDEATSALDNESERIVQDALNHAAKNRTTIVIAHRLSTIRNADKIVVMHKGEIVEQGNHDSLMRIGGTYYKLVEAQKLHITDEQSTQSVRFSEQKRDSTNVEYIHEELYESFEEENSDLKKKKSNAVFAMLKMNSPEWIFIMIGCAACICTGAIVPGIGFLLSKFIGVFQQCTEEKQRENVLLYVLLYVAFGVLYFTAMFLQNFCFACSGEALTKRTRLKLFRTILSQEIAYFDDPKNSTGALCTRLATEASAIQGATGACMGFIFQNIAAFGTATVIGLVFSWQLTLVMLIFVLFMMTGKFLQNRLTIDSLIKDKKALENASKVAVEVIQNIRIVVQLTKEDHFFNIYSQCFTTSYRSSIRRAHIFGIFFSLNNSIGYFITATMFSFGSTLVSNGTISLEDLLLVYNCILFSTEHVILSAALIPDYGKATVAAENIMELFARAPSINNGSSDGDTILNFNGKLEFDNVQFAYPTRSETIVLNNFKLKNRSWSTSASGCGKSTSILLIERFYDVTNGSLLVDSMDIRKLNLQWYRSQIGIVSQEPVLFDMSIQENIAYGDNSRNNIPIEEIIQAAQNANIHEFIQSLPNGYETNCGVKGVQLSGGQKQRIAIARALLRKPKILLLDEATSALDTENEIIVQDALIRAQQNRTSITISHRLSTIQNADVICVIHNGTIVESGTHQELLALHGHYYHLLHKKFNS
ncbi:unnamed protein product [Adineta ricciae]|uniref:Uncharacterized protein n=1 Tax=Adineta ricciae TaxID=249248 RepID=A0A815QR58_ADIRI|nr:unnamed protein product [Adineta ricciae]